MNWNYPVELLNSIMQTLPWSINNIAKQYWVNRVHIKVMDTGWKSQGVCDWPCKVTQDHAQLQRQKANLSSTREICFPGTGIFLFSVYEILTVEMYEKLNFRINYS